MRFSVLLSGALGFSFLLAGGGVAQEGPGSGRGFRSSSTPEERAVRLTEEMKTSLGLSEAQVEKVAAVNLKYAQDSQALREAGGSRDALRRRREELRKRRDAELKLVLTGSQFLAFQQARQKRGRDGADGGRGSAGEDEGGGEKED